MSGKKISDPHFDECFFSDNTIRVNRDDLTTTPNTRGQWDRGDLGMCLKCLSINNTGELDQNKLKILTVVFYTVLDIICIYYTKNTPFYKNDSRSGLRSAEKFFDRRQITDSHLYNKTLAYCMLSITLTLTAYLYPAL